MPTVISTTASPCTLCPSKFRDLLGGYNIQSGTVNCLVEDTFSNNGALSSNPVRDSHGHVTSRRLSELHVVTLGLCSAREVHGSLCRPSNAEHGARYHGLLYSDNVISWFVTLLLCAISVVACTIR